MLPPDTSDDDQPATGPIRLPVAPISPEPNRRLRYLVVAISAFFAGVLECGLVMSAVIGVAPQTGRNDATRVNMRPER